VPEENLWSLWCKGRLTEADTSTIRLGATTSGLSSAHLYHTPDWVKKCMEYEVEGSRPRRPTRTWTEVVRKYCQACNLNKEDAMDRGRWKKLIKTE